MTLTTIKVDAATRDRLKTQARAQGKTLGAYLEHLADGADRRARMAAMREAMASAPAHVMTEYLAETEEWDRIAGGVDGR